MLHVKLYMHPSILSSLQVEICNLGPLPGDEVGLARSVSQ